MDDSSKHFFPVKFFGYNPGQFSTFVSETLFFGIILRDNSYETIIQLVFPGRFFRTILRRQIFIYNSSGQSHFLRKKTNQILSRKISCRQSYGGSGIFFFWDNSIWPWDKFYETRKFFKNNSLNKFPRNIL